MITLMTEIKNSAISVFPTHPKRLSVSFVKNVEAIFQRVENNPPIIAKTRRNHDAAMERKLFLEGGDSSIAYIAAHC
jgi:hypothetical protein